MKGLRPITEGLFDLVDVVLRAQVLARVQTQLRTISPSTTTVPQIILGTISITGGGILYNWSFSPEMRFRYPGHDFTVVVLVTLCMAICLFAIWLLNGKSGERDLRILCAFLLLVGWTSWMNRRAEDEQQQQENDQDHVAADQQESEQTPSSKKNKKRPQKNPSTSEFIVE
ncbi:hypothetical protein BDR26DRAFT_872153 [Obelidium mucronatum]|nr:hypothetical protein BDR26DRAFT_872153 [Obelidium mucronatum]